MKSVSTCFLLVAVLCALCGMAFGIHMSKSQDFMLAPAHAHLNLVGWVSLTLFGLYYAITPAAAQSRLAWVHFALAATGAPVMAVGIAMAILRDVETFAIIGSLLTITSMLVFAFTVLRHGVGPKAG